MAGPVPAQVKADILKNIQDDIVKKGDLRKQVEAKVRSEVKANEKAVLAKLRMGLIQEEKAKLIPKMNAKLAKDVPTAMNSAKFIAEVEAAQLEMKDKLKEDMKKELMEPMERVSKAKMKEEMGIIKERIAAEVKTSKELETNNAVRAATKASKLEPEVKRELAVEMKLDCEKKIKAATKAQVNRELGPILKEVVKAKYEEGTMKEALAFVKQNREEVIRRMVKNEIEKKVQTAVAAKFPGAKTALQAQVEERLETQLFESLKADNAEKLESSTKGMSSADAAAVEFTMNKSLKIQAKKDAQKNAIVEMANGLTKQLKERIEQEERDALQAQIETETEEKVQKEATVISNKAVDKKYEDDLEAMQEGFNHVSQMNGNGKDEEHSGPNVVDAAAIVEEMANGAAKMVANKALNVNATMEDIPEENIPKVDFDKLVNTTAEDAVEEKEVNTTAVTPLNNTEVDANATESGNSTNASSYRVLELLESVTSLF